MSPRVLLILVTLFFFYSLQHANAQNTDLMQRDLSNVQVDQISDEQIRRFIRYADEQNLTDQQIEAGALSRNMPSTEVSKLMSRVRRLRMQRGTTRLQNGFQAQKPGSADTLREQSQSQRDTALEAELTEEEKKVFGSELFNSEDLTFEPSLNIATPQDYQVGPGDELVINIWGASRQTYNLEVTRSGTVVIDNLGPVYVNGLTIEEASRRIINRLTDIYSGLRSGPERPANTYAEVTLGQVRSIKVTIVGEVRKPGTYTLPSLATAFNALYLSGGPTFIGSFRNIEIIRNNKIISELDVYSFLVGGAQSHNVMLKDQDIIRVVPYSNRIELKGQVKRPGYYEVKEDESLAEAIRFSGGFTDKAYTHRLTVRRKTSQAKRIEDVRGEELDTFMPKNGDVVQVDSILDRFENRVEIYGAVFRPGEYALTDSTTLMNLIKRAEGLREDAFTRRILIYRKNENLFNEVLSADLHNISNNTSADIPLKREDIIRVLSVKDLEEEFSVEINGEVQTTGRYPFMYDMTLEDLIAMAGGLKESASKAQVEVARRIKPAGEQGGTNGNDEIETLQTAEIFHFSIGKDLAVDPATAKFVLQPFDQVFIRRSPGYEEQRTVYVKGEVKYPGLYAIKNKNERISDLIDRAGGFTGYAYLEGASLIRLNPEHFEEKIRREEILRDSLKMLSYQRYFTQTNQSTQPNQSTQRNTESRSAYEARATYRGQEIIPVEENLIIEQATVPKHKILEPITQNIGIDLERIMSQPGSRYDIRLLAGDTLEIPKKLETVRMNGELLYPVSSRYDKNKSFKSYISEAGGFTKEADRKRSYIIYANGSVDRTRSFLFFKNYPKVKPGAEIVVPEKEQRQPLTPQAWVGIGSGLATLTLTVITIMDRLR